MQVPMLLVLAVATPVGVLWWAMQALRRWTGVWRVAAIIPVALVLAAIGMAVHGFKTDPMGHGGEAAIGFGLCVLAALIAYVLSEMHQARNRQVADDTKTEWVYVTHGVASSPISIDAIDVWRHEWKRAANGTANVIDPLYGQPFRFQVYEVEDGHRSTVFAAGEFSNGVWGFYRQRSNEEL